MGYVYSWITLKKEKDYRLLPVVWRITLDLKYIGRYGRMHIEYRSELWKPWRLLKLFLSIHKISLLFWLFIKYTTPNYIEDGRPSAGNLQKKERCNETGNKSPYLLWMFCLVCSVWPMTLSSLAPLPFMELWLLVFLAWCYTTRNLIKNRRHREKGEQSEETSWNIYALPWFSLSLSFLFSLCIAASCSSSGSRPRLN